MYTQLRTGVPSAQPPNFDSLQLLRSTLAKAKKQRRLDQQQPKGRSVCLGLDVTLDVVNLPHA